MFESSPIRAHDSCRPIAVIDGVPIFLTEALGAALAALALLLAVTLIALMRGAAARRRERDMRRDERQEAIEARFAALAQSSAELGGRVAGMAEWLGSRQTDLARVVADRLDWSGRGSGRARDQAQTTAKISASSTSGSR